MKKKILLLIMSIVMLNSCGAVAAGTLFYLSYELACATGDINCDEPKSKEEKNEEKRKKLEASLPNGLRTASLDDRYFPIVTYENKTKLKLYKEAEILVPKRIVTKNFENIKIGFLDSGEYLFDEIRQVGYPVAVKKVEIDEKVKLNNILSGKNDKFKIISKNTFIDTENQNKKYYLKKLSENVYISFDYDDNLKEGTQEYKAIKMILKLSESW